MAENNIKIEIEKELIADIESLKHRNKCIKKEFLKAKQQLKRFEWVSVNDRLPEFDGYVIIHGKGGRYVVAVWEKAVSSNNGFQSLDYFNDSFVGCEKVV